MVTITSKSLFFVMLFLNIDAIIMRETLARVHSPWHSHQRCRTMKSEPRPPRSIVACINGRDGSLLKVGTASGMIGPTMVDPFRVALGAGCGDWGVCFYLSVPDAVRLATELDRLVGEQAARG
jgi:hypothetical protein